MPLYHHYNRDTPVSYSPEYWLTTFTGWRRIRKLLDPQLVKPTQSTKKVTLMSATGHHLKATKTVRIRITWGKVRMCHEFIVVSDFKHDMILGVDILNAQNALLDFKNRTLIIGNSAFPLQQKPSQKTHEVNLVRLAEHVDVFSRSDMQLNCFISKKRHTGESFVISQLESAPCFRDEPGVLLPVPAAVVKVAKNKHIP